MTGLVLTLGLVGLGLRLVGPGGRMPGARWLLVPMLCGVALGLDSVVFFWLGLARGPSPWLNGLAEALLIGAGLALVTRPSRRGDPSPLAGGWPAPAAPAAVGFARGVVALAVLLAGIALVRTALDGPDGQGDAWAVWNLKARFLFRETGGWQAAFSDLRPWSCPDYPLLLPGSVARLWMYLGSEAGSETPAVPMGVGLAFSAATVCLLYGAVRWLRGEGLALLALLFFLGHAPAWLHGASQYADVPLGFYMLAALSALALRERAAASHGGPTVLAGLAAGCAAWTKNEGMLFAMVLVALQVSLAVSGRERTRVRQLGWLAVGLLPGLGSALAFKLWIAPAGLHLRPEASRLVQLADGERYLQILRAAGSELLWIGPGLLLAIALLALLAPGVVRRARRPEAKCLAVVLAAMAAGYFAVYLVTPLDLRWHLATSLDRLLLQLWPSGLLLLALLSPEPEALLPAWRRAPTPRAASDATSASAAGTASAGVAAPLAASTDARASIRP